MDLRIGAVHHIFRMALALHPNLRAFIFGHDGDHIQIDASCQHPATLMIRMIAAYLRAARRTEQKKFPIFSIQRFKSIHRFQGAAGIFFGLFLAAHIDMGQFLI